MTDLKDSLHTVTIAGTEDDPKIEFTCHGDRDAECHNYPDCDCERWTRSGHEHEFVPHDDCWMKTFFDNADDGGVNPQPEYLAEDDITVGMSGPIKTYFDIDGFIEWEFVDG